MINYFFKHANVFSCFWYAQCTYCTIYYNTQNVVSIFKQITLKIVDRSSLYKTHCKLKVVRTPLHLNKLSSKIVYIFANLSYVIFIKSSHLILRMKIALLLFGAIHKLRKPKRGREGASIFLHFLLKGQGQGEGEKKISERASRNLWKPYLSLKH